MLEAYCSNCNELIVIHDENKIECPKCFGIDLDNISKVKQDEKDFDVEKNNEVIGLELVYQKTLKKITVPKSKVILGRENMGASLFSKIKVNGNPVISRSHCSLEFDSRTNKYMIEDLGSLNGTFVNDKECVNKVVIEKNSIIKFGRELFVSKYLYKSIQPVDASNNTIEADKNIEIVFTYFCPDCSKHFKKDGFCPDCDVKLKKV
jgi:Zn-finger nucleic acid-binding protein